MERSRPSMPRCSRLCECGHCIMSGDMSDGVAAYDSLCLKRVEC